MREQNLLSNNITRGAIFTALSLIVLYLSSLISINTIFFLLGASALIPLCLLTTNLSTTLLVYISTSVLSIFFVPNKEVAIFYICLFGIYGILKYLIEKLDSTTLELIIKLVYFNLASLLIIYLVKVFLFKNILTIPIYFFLIGLTIACFVLDYALTVFINYANNHLLKHLK